MTCPPSYHYELIENNKLLEYRGLKLGAYTQNEMTIDICNIVNDSVKLFALSLPPSVVFPADQCTYSCNHSISMRCSWHSW